MTAIYQDLIVNWEDAAGNAEAVIFAVEVDGAEIYRGRLLCVDGFYAFNLSGIVSDTLAQAFPPSLGSGKAAYPETATADAAPAVVRAVTVRGWYASTDGDPDFTETVDFFYDWSYDDDSDVPARQPGFLRSDPIDGQLHPLQFVILTAFDDLDLMTVTQRLPAGGNDFNADFSADFGGGGDVVESLSIDRKTNAILPPGTWAGDVEVTDGERRVDFHVLPCSRARYVLHYVNAFGGWDSFVPTGLCKVSDALTRKEYTRRHVNADAGAWIPGRGRTVYHTEAARRFEMHTGFMTEAQAARIRHLLESPQVWIFDTVEARFLPAIINDSSFEFKTHAGERGKLIEYTLNLSEAFNRIRK